MINPYGEMMKILESKTDDFSKMLCRILQVRTLYENGVLDSDAVYEELGETVGRRLVKSVDKKQDWELRHIEGFVKEDMHDNDSNNE